MWTASHIYFTPTREVLAFFATHPVFSRGLHVIDGTEGWRAEWCSPLPESGLGAIREVFPDGAVGVERNSESLIWSPRSGLAPVAILRAPLQEDGGYQGEDISDELLAELKHVAALTSSTVAFYHHTTWAGATEHEFAWVFGSTEFAAAKSGHRPALVVAANSTTTDHLSVLQLVMSAFGVEMTSSIFAPHMRAFPWPRFAKEPQNLRGPLSAALRELLGDNAH